MPDNQPQDGQPQDGQPQDRNRLRKVLALLDSREEGEAMAALRQGRRLLAESGLTFRDLLAVDITAAPQASESLMVTSLKAYAEDLKARVAEAQAAADAWQRKAETVQREISDLKSRAAEIESRRQLQVKAFEQAQRTADSKLKSAQGQAETWRRRAESLAAAQAVPGASTSEPPTDSATLASLPLESRIAELERVLAVAPIRSNADKRAEVLRLLGDPLTARLADREIARQAGVAPQTVSNWRRRLNRESGRLDPKERMVRRRGRSYTMHTGKIGQTA